MYNGAPNPINIIKALVLKVFCVFFCTFKPSVSGPGLGGDIVLTHANPHD